MGAIFFITHPIFLDYAFTLVLFTDKLLVMAEGELFRARIEGIAAGGAGLAHYGGKSVFIDGTAADELVSCRVIEEHRSWCRAEALDIIEASPERAAPRCDWYGICGGCNLQHLSYEAQLAAKTAMLNEAFIRIGGFSPPEPAVYPSAPWEYRNRTQFHRTGGGGFGFKGRKSGGVVPVSDCPVADPLIRAVLRKAAAGERALPLPPEKDRFTVYARDGLLLSEGGLLDREIVLDAGVFFQSNGAMLESLIADIRAIAAGSGAADRNRPMADLFCGVGTFAAFTADLFPRADLVEENKNALAIARENVRDFETAFFACGDADWVKLKSREKRAAPYGFVVVDPPRQGLSPALARWLAAEGPAPLAYVSCDPATLARDSAILIQGGYELAELRLYDFYPQTAHIESLAIFH